MVEKNKSFALNKSNRTYHIFDNYLKVDDLYQAKI